MEAHVDALPWVIFHTENEQALFGCEAQKTLASTQSCLEEKAKMIQARMNLTYTNADQAWVQNDFLANKDKGFPLWAKAIRERYQLSELPKNKMNPIADKLTELCMWEADMRASHAHNLAVESFRGDIARVERENEAWRNLSNDLDRLNSNLQQIQTNERLRRIERSR